MDTNTKVFGNSSPASGAELRGVFGGDFNYPAGGSLLRFPLEDTEEPKPRHITHRPVEAVGAIPRVHLLNADGVVFLEQSVGNLEMKVPPLVAYLLVSLGDKDSSLSSSLGAFDPTGEPLLPHSEGALGLLEKAWVFYLLASRGSQKGLATDIYTYHLASLGQRFGGNIVAGEAHIPLGSRYPADGYGFNVPLNGAGQPDFEPAYISDGKVFAFQFPACLCEGKAVISIPAFEAWEASLAVAILDSAEKASIGFVQPLKHLLKDLRAYISVFGKRYLEFGKLFNLAIAGDMSFVLFMDGYSLLKCRVVEPTAKVEPVVGFLKGWSVCQKTIFECLFHSPSTILNIAYFRKGIKSLIHPQH